MKILIEDLKEGEEEQVVFRVKNITKEHLRLIALIKARSNPLIVFRENNIFRISPSLVYYFEAVDNKVYVYCKDSIYESKQKLYELEELYKGGDFMRVSKSAVVNLTKINALSPAFNGRFEAQLDNNEKIIISRQYVNEMKKRFGV